MNALTARRKAKPNLAGVKKPTRKRRKQPMTPECPALGTRSRKSSNTATEEKELPEDEKSEGPDPDATDSE